MHFYILSQKDEYKIRARQLVAGGPLRSHDVNAGHFLGVVACHGDEHQVLHGELGAEALYRGLFFPEEKMKSLN